MANAGYTKYFNRILGAGTNSLIAWSTDTIKVILANSANYTPAITTDAFLSDVPSAGRTATATVASVTITGKVVSAANTTFTAATGVASQYLILYKDTGTASTSPLAIFFDTFTSGMPVTPNGGDIIVAWNGSGIFTF